MRQQKEIELNGDKYQLTQFGARQGIKLGKKVARLLLPALAAVYSENQEDFELAAALEVVGENLDHLDDATIQELLSSVTKNKYAIDFDNEFAGNYMTLFKLLWEVIQFNFSDLFSMAQVVSGAQ